MCQNTTMRVNTAWIKRYCHLCSKIYNTLYSCHNFPAGSRQAARGARVCETSLFEDQVPRDKFHRCPPSISIMRLLCCPCPIRCGWSELQIICNKHRFDFDTFLCHSGEVTLIIAASRLPILTRIKLSHQTGLLSETLTLRIPGCRANNHLHWGLGAPGSIWHVYVTCVTRFWWTTQGMFTLHICNHIW